MKISITVNYENKVTIDNQVFFVPKLVKSTLLGVLERKNIRFTEGRKEWIYEIDDATELEEIRQIISYDVKDLENLVPIWLKYDLLDIEVECYERGRGWKYVSLSRIEEYSLLKYAEKKVVVDDEKHTVKFSVSFTVPRVMWNELFSDSIFVGTLKACLDDEDIGRLWRSKQDLLIRCYLGKSVSIDYFEEMKKKVDEKYWYAIKYFLNKNKEKYPLIFFVYPELLITLK